MYKNTKLKEVLETNFTNKGKGANILLLQLLLWQENRLKK